MKTSQATPSRAAKDNPVPQTLLPQPQPQPGSTLLAHCGARFVTRTELADVPEPETLGPRHQPISHHHLVETLAAVLGDEHLHITREEFAVYGGQSDRLFGVLDVRSSNGLAAWARAGQGFSLGLRSANDRSMALQLAVGQRVLVCDNLCFAGDLIALRRRHTRGLQLKSELRAAIRLYKSQLATLVDQTDRAKTIELHDQQAKALIFDEFRRGTLPYAKLPKVASWYFDPPAEATDVSAHPHTLWALTQAFTREMRNLKPARKFTATTRIGKLLVAV